MLTIDVAICTLGREGIERVAKMPLPHVDGVRYVISWQTGEDTVPATLRGRSDLVVYPTPTRGLSINRNHAISHCTSDIILFSDDDVRYRRDHLLAVRDCYEAHPEIDYALFRYGSEHGKYYPKEEYRIGKHLAKNHCVSSVEISIRRKVVEEGLRFDERFGLGAPTFHCAEEALFVLSIMRSGYAGMFFPVDDCYNPNMTTGKRRITDSGVTKAMGAHIALEYPVTSLPRIFLKSWRMGRRGQQAFLPALYYLLSGWASGLVMRPPWRRR